jgi:hypothetical protein
MKRIDDSQHVTGIHSDAPRFLFSCVFRVVGFAALGAMQGERVTNR